MMVENVEKLTVEEALFVPEGGYRSILGTLKHAARLESCLSLICF